MVSQAGSDAQKETLMEVYDVFDEKGRVAHYADQYLISPLQLEVKMTQNEPETALKQKKTLMDIEVEL